MRAVDAAIAVLLLSVTGSGAELTADAAARRPRIRLASTPYPNPLFRLLNDAEFGEHRYQFHLLPLDAEVSRGHFYTRRGGMIDLAHLRKTVDWAGWLQAASHRDLEAGRTELTYRCSEPSVYRITVQLPPEFLALPPARAAAFRQALSVELGLTVAYTALTWHEILTWYGYSAIPGLSEKQSAFSVEDMYTHAVGIAVARRALGDESRAYDYAVTVALEAEIARLEPMSRADAEEALRATRGQWWTYGRTLKRAVQIGESGPLSPCLVSCHPCSNPATYPAPRIGVVNGIDMSGLVSVEIDPKVRQSAQISRVLGRSDGPIQPAADFPKLVQDIRRQN